MIFTRRELGWAVGSAIALPAFAATAASSKIKGVQIGLQSYSLRQGVPKSEIIPDMVKVGLNEVELMSGDAEALAGAPNFAPVPRGPRPAGGGRPQMTPEQQATMAEHQKAIKDWRTATTAATFEGVRKQFGDAGIDLRILCYNMGAKIADDEIDYAFRMAKAMKVRAISSSSTVAVAKRIPPFADKYNMIWAGHGHDDVADPEQFAKPETFEMIMALNPHIDVNLDIGHFTAAGYDPIPFIQKHHARISNIHLKDRKKNTPAAHGANLPWGEGDTPIKEVLLLMSKEKYAFPANIELEYRIPEGSDPVAEVAKCYAYAKKCLEG